MGLQSNMGGMKIRFIQNCFRFKGRPKNLFMQVVTIYATESVTLVKFLMPRIDVSRITTSIALWRVERESPLVSYPNLDPWRCSLQISLSKYWSPVFGILCSELPKRSDYCFSCSIQDFTVHYYFGTVMWNIFYRKRNSRNSSTKITTPSICTTINNSCEKCPT